MAERGVSRLAPLIGLEASLIGPYVLGHVTEELLRLRGAGSFSEISGGAVTDAGGEGQTVHSPKWLQPCFCGAGSDDSCVIF